MTEPTDPRQPGDATGPTEPTAAESAEAKPAIPATPSPDDDRVAVLAAYLRSNRGRFTDEALSGAARAAGYTEAEIAAARSVADPTTDVGPSPARRLNHGVVAAVAILYVVALYLVISTAASMSSDVSGTVALVGLLGGVIAWALLRNERPSLARGFGIGVVLAVAIPIVAILVIIGICVATGTFPSS